MEIKFAEFLQISSAIVAALVAAVVYLFLSHQRKEKRHSIEMKDLYKSYLDEQKENIEKITQVVADNKNALDKLTTTIDQNTRVTDKLFDKITSATK